MYALRKVERTFRRAMSSAVVAVCSYSWLDGVRFLRRDF